MSAQANFWSSTDIVSQLLSEIHPHTKNEFVTYKNASDEAKLSIPFNPDYCEFFDILYPLKYFYFSSFQFFNFAQINVRSSTTSLNFEGRYRHQKTVVTLGAVYPPRNPNIMKDVILEFNNILASKWE